MISIAFYPEILEAWIKENPNETVYRVPDGFNIIRGLKSKTLLESKIKKIILPPSISIFRNSAIIGPDFLFSFNNFLLEELEFEDGGTDLEIGEKVFACATIRKIVLPKTTPIFISKEAFCSNNFVKSGLEEIIIPENAVIKNAEGLFYNCKTLKKCEIKCKIGSYVSTKSMFENCTSLTEVTLPKEFKKGTTTFRGCTSLVLKKKSKS